MVPWIAPSDSQEAPRVRLVLGQWPVLDGFDMVVGGPHAPCVNLVPQVVQLRCEEVALFRAELQTGVAVGLDDLVQMVEVIVEGRRLDEAVVHENDGNVGRQFAKDALRQPVRNR